MPRWCARTLQRSTSAASSEWRRSMGHGQRAVQPESSGGRAGVARAQGAGGRAGRRDGCRLPLLHCLPLLAALVCAGLTDVSCAAPAAVVQACGEQQGEGAVQVCGCRVGWQKVGCGWGALHRSLCSRMAAGAMLRPRCPNPALCPWPALASARQSALEGSYLLPSPPLLCAFTPSPLSFCLPPPPPLAAPAKSRSKQ